ncbi:SIS domain-containing protein [Ramlibacter sp. RBP-2]|uniref:SIS domain-containing protein n=1 Tax=Ramlibacter lithotrophicus TaxID=2606681 RepID=A0A7X6I8R3_9BURK|nr:SIS domain-containing protein [Ramlibacter lithotrophicus]NKE68635.1 SIS domain-containing protein [Ramlibacter lithotrophicus]
MSTKPAGTPRACIEAALREAAAATESLLNDDGGLIDIEHGANLLIRAFEAGKRVFSCGNGGSMSDAMHFAEELTGRYRNNRAGLPAQAISDVGHLTCVANDFGYDQVFSRYVLSHGRAGDCLVAISTSGNSTNVINAAVAAKDRGMTVLALTGKRRSVLGALADVCICTPAGFYADRVQELHIKVIHILIELVERHFFAENYADLDLDTGPAS